LCDLTSYPLRQALFEGDCPLVAEFYELIKIRVLFSDPNQQ
jgi:hypothetical protein